MKVKQHKLQTKLFRAYLFLTCLILFSFAAFFYIFVSKRLTTSQIQAMDTLNSSFLSQVDSAIRDLDIVSVNINYTNMSKNVLNQEFELNISDNMLSDMADLFLAISGTELKAAQINLYDFSGNVLQVGLSTLVKKADEQQMELTRQARELEGSKIITVPYSTDKYSKSAKYQQWFISLYRSFNNQYGRPVGAIETMKQCKNIFKSIISYEKRNKKNAALVCVFDKDGALVYPYEIDQEKAVQLSRFFPLAQNYQSTSSYTSPVDGTKVYLSKNVSTYTGYTYLTIQPEAAILAPVYDLLKILIAVVGIFLAVAGFISYKLSRSVVRPIKHLKHIIQRLQLDTLGQEKATGYPVSVNELEELYQAFQIMNDNLKDSMNQLIKSQEQEMKSRTLALQTQMNPHFYYNTLSSIIVLAENNDTDVVVKMCRNLSKIMRYITDTGSMSVTLHDEIDYVQKYLYCMKVRYQTSLNYSIDIDERLWEEQVPKLIIQPLVENAIKYGTNCMPPWEIKIHGYIKGDHWQIDVIDSGNGFSSEAIDKITDNIAQAQKNPGMPDMKINGLGTLNVYLRWKLFCKEDMIFQYGNTEDGHGIVSVGRKWDKNEESINKEGTGL